MMTIVWPARAGIGIDTLQSLPILDVVPLNSIALSLSSIYDNTTDASPRKTHGSNVSLAASTSTTPCHAGLAMNAVMDADATRRCLTGPHGLDMNALAATMMDRSKERRIRKDASWSQIGSLGA